MNQVKSRDTGEGLFFFFPSTVSPPDIFSLKGLMAADPLQTPRTSAPAPWEKKDVVVDNTTLMTRFPKNIVPYFEDHPGTGLPFKEAHREEIIPLHLPELPLEAGFDFSNLAQNTPQGFSVGLSVLNHPVPPLALSCALPLTETLPFATHPVFAQDQEGMKPFDQRSDSLRVFSSHDGNTGARKTLPFTLDRIELLTSSGQFSLSDTLFVSQEPQTLLKACPFMREPHNDRLLSPQRVMKELQSLTTSSPSREIQHVGRLLLALMAEQATLKPVELLYFVIKNRFSSAEIKNHQKRPVLIHALEDIALTEMGFHLLDNPQIEYPKLKRHLEKDALQQLEHKLITKREIKTVLTLALPISSKVRGL